MLPQERQGTQAPDRSKGTAIKRAGFHHGLIYSTDRRAYPSVHAVCRAARGSFTSSVVADQSGVGITMAIDWFTRRYRTLKTANKPHTFPTPRSFHMQYA